MEARAFYLQLDCASGPFVAVKESHVLGTPRLDYVLVGGRKKATLFHGPVEEDATLIERVSLALGRVQRDFRVVEGGPCWASHVFLVGVAQGVEHSDWKPGDYVSATGLTSCAAKDTPHYTHQEEARGVITALERQHRGVRFTILAYRLEPT